MKNALKLKLSATQQCIRNSNHFYPGQEMDDFLRLFSTQKIPRAKKNFQNVEMGSTMSCVLQHFRSMDICESRVKRPHYQKHTLRGANQFTSNQTLKICDFLNSWFDLFLGSTTSVRRCSTRSHVSDDSPQTDHSAECRRDSGDGTRGTYSPERHPRTTLERHRRSLLQTVPSTISHCPKLNQEPTRSQLMS